MKLDPGKSAIRVSAAAVARVMPFVAKGDVRYYLGGVAVQPVAEGGVIAMATDGHILLAMRDPHGTADKPVILPFGDGRTAPALRKAGAEIHVQDDGVVWIADKHGAPCHISPDPLIDGNFPDVQSLTSREWLPGPSGDSLRLDLLHRISAAAGGKYSSGVRFFHQSSPHMAALFTVGTNCFGVIMPMYDEAPMKTLASAVPAAWLQAPAEVSA